MQKTASRHFENFDFVIYNIYSPVGEYNSLIRPTNQLVGFVMFTCAKIH
jgi:hypothetical protein